jgi:yecA family protein
MPLSNDDLERLDELLARDAEAEAIDSVEMLDGYLCALVASGAPVSPQDYLGVVWPEDHPWATPGDRAEAHRLAQALAADIERRVAFAGEEPGEEDFPIALPMEQDEIDLDSRELPIGADWAIGFDLGMSHRASAWESMLDAIEGLDEFLDGIDELLAVEDAGDEGDDGDRAEAPTAQRRMEIIGTIPYVLRDLVQGQRED